MYLLAGDIGGTKTLLGIYKFNNGLELINKIHYVSKEWEGFDLILSHFLSKLPKDIERPKYGCIGVAGAISHGNVKLTNLKWQINESRICKMANLKKLILINDFLSFIYGIPFLSKNQYASLQSPKGNQNNDKNNSLIAVIGAGTGLGIGRALINNNGIKAIASEGGHKEFSPRNETEWELTKWLKKDLNINRLSIERIVSGTGLGNIARWRISRTDAIRHPLHEIINNKINQNLNNIQLPEQVCKLAQSGDLLMQEVVNTWISAYGSAAGDLALHELCEGGLWIAGGTAKKHLKDLSSDKFLKPLKNKGRFTQFLEKIPIMALIDSDAGLFGAACKAHLISKSDDKLI